VQIINKSIN